jgi:hypothetical protein
MNNINIILVVIIIILSINLYFRSIPIKVLPYDVIVLGCARDISIYLDTTKKKLHMINKMFRSTNIIIYENDSIDDTLSVLRGWEDEGLIRLITETNVKGKRTERLAHARNILYREGMKYSFDYMIVMDLDDVITRLSYNGIMSCFNTKEDWGMIGSNQIFNYYDIWALRTIDSWLPFDCWYCNNIDKKGLKYCITDRIRRVSYFSNMIQVKSCFGGIAIYKRQYLDNCSYGDGVYHGTDIEICEHVVFNNYVVNNGGKIYINPKFINFYNFNIISNIMQNIKKKFKN